MMVYIVQMVEGNNRDAHATEATEDKFQLTPPDTEGWSAGHELDDTYTDIPWSDLWYDCSVTDRDRQRIV